MSADRVPTRPHIRAIRRALGEDTATFGARFARSARTVEDWEQGRRHPDALVWVLLEKIIKKLHLPT